MVLQWGITPNIGNTFTAISFPVSFKNNCYVVTATMFCTNVHNEFGIIWKRNNISSMLILCRSYGGNASNEPLSYICIGV